MNAVVVKQVASSQDLTAALDVRLKVFVAEQGVEQGLEIDGLDGDSEHIIVYDGGTPVGTARIRCISSAQGKLERVAVLKPYRGRGIGKRIIEECLKLLRMKGILEVTLNAQQTAVGFYRKLGFHQVGEQFEDAGIPHVTMIGKL